MNIWIIWYLVFCVDNFYENTKKENKSELRAGKKDYQTDETTTSVKVCVLCNEKEKMIRIQNSPKKWETYHPQIEKKRGRR